MREGRVDHRLQRRRVLAELRDGQRFREDVCDAHPELLRAARHLGTRVDDPCPVCAGDELVHVSYVFEGRSPRAPGGRAVPADAIARIARRRGALTVYVVEVCAGCGWHHLVESYRQPVVSAAGTAP